MIPLLEMRNITKEFPGVRALDNVSFSVYEGEIHGLVGENGAGKSTLMKVLSGVYPHGTYSGDILLHETLQEFKGISDSERAGIAIIYQELALVPEMTVYENIFLGHEIHRGLVVDWNETIKRANEMLQRVRLDVNPETKVKDLGVGKQQLVEIAKALNRDVKILIMDEPTAALNEDDSANLLNLLREQRSHGVTCILISHKLREVIAIADSITVLRDGKTICTLDNRTSRVPEPVLIKSMVGREITNIYPPRERHPLDEIVLEVKNWNAYHPQLGRDILKDIHFNVKKGEIVGFAGLMGSGRTELALSMFGNPDGYHVSGEIYLYGNQVHLGHPKDAIKAGVAYLSEDRKSKGLILIQDVKQNLTLANLREIARRGVIDGNAEIQVATEYKDSLNIRTPSIEQVVSHLSGGNQQKVYLGKWLFVKPDVLILDEPTRGIDVGAKYEIYTIMNRLIQQGMSIIMISSELPEILGMSDRVYVVSGGKIVSELPIEEASQEIIMDLATDY
ncbi:MAG TPA: sugar ABC transporter ATP-binding protein [Anaerolineae bacterium]|nr:sugar ABC transporter ATP-binding protein [Anaerolineae bacterium]HQH38319.1 sugar ABC transporter ATP-binding protein [Anaerolineae bacterium]